MKKNKPRYALRKEKDLAVRLPSGSGWKDVKGLQQQRDSLPTETAEGAGRGRVWAITEGRQASGWVSALRGHICPQGHSALVAKAHNWPSALLILPY